MSTLQDLNEVRYIVHLTHNSDAAPESCHENEHTCYLVGQWPEPELSVLAKDDHSVIRVFDSVYFSPKITHAKVFRTIIDARKDTNWLELDKAGWKAHIMPVNAKIFFVAGLGNNKYE